MKDNCPICCGDSFECGGGVRGVCYQSPGGPYCALDDGNGAACGEHDPCPIHKPPAVPEAPALPEGWVFDGDETMPGYESHAGDTVEWTDGSLTVGIRHSGYNTHYFTEIPLAVLMRLLATQGLSIIGAKDRAVLEALANPDQGALEWVAAELARREGK